MNKSDYIVKLQETFNGEKFLKLSKSCLKKNIREFQNDLNKFKRFLDPEIHWRLEKNEKLKSGYGLLKIHKENHPLRPIVSSMNTLTSNSESYILEKISFIEEKLKYSIKSTLEFKQKFLEE